MELNRHCRFHAVFESRISASSVLRYRVDQRRLAILDLRDRPLKRWLEIVGVLDGTFGPPAHREGEAGEVGPAPNIPNSSRDAALTGLALSGGRMRWAAPIVAWADGVHCEIGWTKLAALAEWAAFATKTLWH